jgi:hypothetical protein
VGRVEQPGAGDVPGDGGLHRGGSHCHPGAPARQGLCARRREAGELLDGGTGPAQREEAVAGGPGPRHAVEGEPRPPRPRCVPGPPARFQQSRGCRPGRPPC